MSFFGGSSTPTTSTPDMVAKKEALMNQIKSETALMNAQELINKTNEKCFAKCVLKPSSSLTSSEQNCLTNCLGRYMEAFTIVSRAYTARLAKEIRHEPSSL